MGRQTHIWRKQCVFVKCVFIKWFIVEVCFIKNMLTSVNISHNRKFKQERINISKLILTIMCRIKSLQKIFRNTNRYVITDAVKQTQPHFDALLQPSEMERVKMTSWRHKKHLLAQPHQYMYVTFSVSLEQNLHFVQSWLGQSKCQKRAQAEKVRERLGSAPQSQVFSHSRLFVHGCFSKQWRINQMSLENHSPQHISSFSVHPISNFFSLCSKMHVCGLKM